MTSAQAADRLPLALVFRTPEQGNVHAVEAAAGRVWIGCCRKPSLLLAVRDDLSAIQEIRFDEESGLHDLAFDGTHLWAAHASGHLSRIDPQTARFSSARVRMTSGEPAFLYTLHFDGEDLWAGTYTDPGCLLRIDRASGGITELPLPAAPMWSVRALTVAHGCVWACLYTAGGKVVLLDQRSGKQRTLELGDENLLCTSCAFDGTFVWIGLDTMPARLVRVHAKTLQVATCDLHAGSSCIRALRFDGRHLWLGLYAEPGELVRFDPQTQRFDRHVMPADFFNVRDLVVEGERVWAVTQNVRYQPSGLYGLPRQWPERQA